MNAASPTPFKSGYMKLSTDTLIEARQRLTEILDLRARQWSLFEDESAEAAKVYIRTEYPHVLSPSALNTFLDCSAYWYYKKVLGLPDKRTLALGLGSAVHEALGTNFKAKIATGEDLPSEAVRTVFRDSFEKQLDEVTLEADDDIADAKNCGEVMLNLYMREAAPTIEPAAVEKPVSGEIAGIPVSGFIDLLDVDGRIIDLKTAAKKPAAFPVPHKRQVTTYTMLEPNASGVVRLDTLTKTKTVNLHSQTAQIGMEDRRHVARLYSIAFDQMRTGLIIPNRCSFKCSKRLCAYYEQCMDDFGGTVE
jgi:RecB family exonuclease